jgi:small subunit ribosomal protein S16
MARVGSCHKPFYRITVADSRSAATGKFLQQIGHYDPNQNPPVMKVDEASALKWIRNGARPSDTVKSLFHRQGIMEKSRLIEKGRATGETPVKLRAVGPKKLKVHKKVKEAQAVAAKEAQATAVKEAQAAATAKAAAVAAAAKADEAAKAASPAE